MKWFKVDLMDVLIYVGVFDYFGLNCVELLISVFELMLSVELVGGSMSLFELLVFKIKK